MSNFMTQAFLTCKGLFMWLNPPSLGLHEKVGFSLMDRKQATLRL